MKLLTCESVFAGHPDKVCDQISDAIVTECLAQDPKSRVAVECAIKDNLVVLLGEVTTNANINYEEIAKETLKGIGYTEDFEVLVKISKQSRDIALGVDKEGAGDQGMMYGYATNETDAFIPYPLLIAQSISRKMDDLRKSRYSDIFGPDGKCQVTVDERNNIKKIIVSAQTKPGADKKKVRSIIENEVIKHLVPALRNVDILINPTGAFEIGGPYADSGLTGRKIIVDTYGGVARHGGGAFSGKDPSKVDRSGAYYCRYVAKSLVKAGFCSKCEVSVSYSIGVAQPVSISVDTFGTATIPEYFLLNLINKCFDFKPASIRKELRLNCVNYERTACYGHFGRTEVCFPWEDVDDKVKELQEAVFKL